MIKNNDDHLKRLAPDDVKVGEITNYAN